MAAACHARLGSQRGEQPLIEAVPRRFRFILVARQANVHGQNRGRAEPLVGADEPHEAV